MTDEQEAEARALRLRAFAAELSREAAAIGRLVPSFESDAIDVARGLRVIAAALESRAQRGVVPMPNRKR